MARSARLVSAASATAASLLAIAGIVPLALGQVQQRQRAAIAVDAPPMVAQPDNGEDTGKDHNEFVFVRDSATAQEKFNLAVKMERLKEWSKSAELYQEVLEKYRDRVIPAGKEKGVNVRYTSVTWGVLEKLSKWPQEGLDIYRGRYEPKAAELVASAKGDNLGPLYEAFQRYFVTESAKQAGIRLIDAGLERGEYAAAAEVGDHLLNDYPKGSLLAERPQLLFRTALAYALAGDATSRTKSAERAQTLATEFPKITGVVRGKDVVLADAIKTEAADLANSGAAGTVTTGDSWPMFGGGPSRGVISTSKALPGTRLFSIPLAKPSFGNVAAANRPSMQAAFDEASKTGLNTGVFPVVDRGELFFQDGTRIYASTLESGVPLPAWQQTWPDTNGQFVLRDANTLGSSRSSQQTLTVTDRYVVAVMGQPDRQAAMLYNAQVQGESRLVCLDRQTGRDIWKVQLTTSTDIPKNDDEKAIRSLSLNGSPLVVGDTVLVTGKSARPNQGEDCYVLSFELGTGKFRWACYVASSGVPVNMYGPPQIPNETTTHLAYANGRVYCLTNLGAVAALDAYGGTIVWLNIYPVDQSPVSGRGGFAPVFQSGPTGAKLKPWQHNPAVLSEGKLFILPTESKNLLVYDAVSGKEVKRVPVDSIGRWTATLAGGGGEPDKPTTLLGVMSNRILLAGERGIGMYDWTKFDEEPMRDGVEATQVFWHNFYPNNLRGRPFLTESAVYTADERKVRLASVQNGGIINGSEYPPGNNEWDTGETPGNILVSGDHVVIAGPKSVDIYTDLNLATAKLDKEVGSAPRDPEPRLRYAEVMFAAGRSDLSLTKLGEAIGLMGGIEKLPPGQNRDRLFNDAVAFAGKLAADERPGAREKVDPYFDIAGSAAGNPQQYVQYRMARAKFSEAKLKNPAAAAKLYQEVLSRPEARAVTLVDEQTNTPAQAEDLAEKAIAALIRVSGPSIYEPFEKEARTALESANAESDLPTKAGKLLAIAQVYPNASVASAAMMSAADAYESASAPRQSIRVLRQMWFKFQNGPGRTSILEAIARNYLAVPDRSRAEMAGTASARLGMAQQLVNDGVLSKDLKLPDGTLVAKSGDTFSKALDSVRALSISEATKKLPDFKIPPQATRRPWTQAFLPQDKNESLPDATALVLSPTEFARPDRIVTWSPNGLSIFKSGNGMPKDPVKTPIFVVAGPNPDNPTAAVPRGVSWSGDTALVWGSSRVVAINSASGQIVWKMDLASMGQLDVLRTGEAVAGTAPEPNNINNFQGQIQINGRVNGGVIIRNGMVIRGQAAVAQVAAQPAAPNQNPAQPSLPAGAGEQVADVRPVGDRVLITSNTGRIVSADLAGGQVNWQSRLSEQTPDRLVATEDFTVVRTSDELSVRLVALDTFSGRVIGSKAYSRQSNSFPVNIALSAEGTLVYTMPDRLCLKDLYKAWEEDEKVITSAPSGTPSPLIYAGASLPGQLVITEGRILAVADSISAVAGLPSNEKYVRVHSLETGQPLQMKYKPEGGRKDVDLILTSGTKDWNVSIRAVGAKVYVFGPKTIYGYNLDKPGESWRGSPNYFDADPLADDGNFRDTFVGARHIVVLDQPTGNPNQPAQYRLHAIARYPATSAGGKGESGKLDHTVTITHPVGVAPQWQACDGGFVYATNDGKVRMLVGAEQK